MLILTRRPPRHFWGVRRWSLAIWICQSVTSGFSRISFYGILKRSAVLIISRVSREVSRAFWRGVEGREGDIDGVKVAGCGLFRESQDCVEAWEDGIDSWESRISVRVNHDRVGVLSNRRISIVRAQTTSISVVIEREILPVLYLTWLDSRTFQAFLLATSKADKFATLVENGQVFRGESSTWLSLRHRKRKYRDTNHYQWKAASLVNPTSQRHSRARLICVY